MVIQQLIFRKVENNEQFTIALELTLTWINRIIFLKLLEGQILSFNDKERKYSFLQKELISNFSELQELFFGVLSVKQIERQPEVLKNKFENVPYLNSSLF